MELLDHWLLSSDTHIVEPPDLYTSRMSERFLDQAPRTEVRDGYECWILEDRVITKVGVPFRAGDRFKEEGERPPRLDFATGVEESGYIASEWLRVLESDSVYGGVVFPSVSMIMYAVPDTALLDDIMSAYNGWIHEFAAADPRRIKPIGMVNVDDPEHAARQVEHLRSQGFGGALIPVAPPIERPYSLPDYEPLWAAAAANGMPLHLHVVTDRNPGRYGHTTLRAAIKVNDPDYHVRLALTDLIYNGVFERHPDLKVVSVEHEGGWLRHWMNRMDWHYRYNLSLIEERFKGTALPSDFVARNVYISFSDDEVLVADRDAVGVDHLMWGSDYPHSESTYPHSREMAAAQVDGLSPQERRQITQENTAELYGFEVPEGEPGGAAVGG